MLPDLDGFLTSGRLAYKVADVSKVHDLITPESKVEALVSVGSFEVLFTLGHHEHLTSDK